MNSITEQIKNRLTMRDVLSQYIGYNGSRNRIPCPIHQGKNDNFAFDDGRYICFRCGSKGDVFTFVMEYFGVNFNSAVQKLNDDFGLNLLKPKLSYRERVQAIRTEKEREAKRMAAEIERQRLEDNYWNAFDEWLKHDINKTKYKPRSAEEGLHPLFVDALLNIENAKYNLEMAEIERSEFGKCPQI